MQRRVLCMLLVILLLALAAPYVLADDDDHEGRVVVIQNYGAPTFLYGGYSYVPLKSAADFVGAALLWDSVRNRATLTYNGREVGLVVGSPNAYYGGRTVVMPVAPIMVEDRVLVPAMVFDRYLGVPVEWNDEDDRVMLRGPHGWGYYQVAPYPPPAVIAVVERHGPPPWAPAHGWRRKHGPTYYVAAPFVYSGVTYVPLRDAASLVGAALLWDSLKGQAVLTYNGREIGLAIGSPTVVYGGQPVVLAAAPVVVQQVVYVPVDFCRQYLRMPVQHDHGVLKLKGSKGWHEYKVASRPPGPVSHGREQRVRQVSREKAPRSEKRVRAEKRRGDEGQVKKDRGGRPDLGRDPFKRGGRVERDRGASKHEGGRAERGGGASKHEGGGKGQGKGKGGR